MLTAKAKWGDPSQSQMVKGDAEKSGYWYWLIFNLIENEIKSKQTPINSHRIIQWEGFLDWGIFWIIWGWGLPLFPAPYKQRTNRPLSNITTTPWIFPILPLFNPLELSYTPTISSKFGSKWWSTPTSKIIIIVLLYALHIQNQLLRTLDDGFCLSIGWRWTDIDLSMDVWPPGAESRGSCCLLNNLQLALALLEPTKCK